MCDDGFAGFCQGAEINLGVRQVDGRDELFLPIVMNLCTG